MRIEYTNWRLANNYGDMIELNKGLKDYPILHNQILKHELGHSNGYKVSDLNHDLTENKVSIIELSKFIYKNPKSLAQLLPFYWHKEYGFVYDISLIIIYSVILLIIGLGTFLAFRI